MRRTDREVTDAATISAIMARCKVVRLAMNTDGAPYILPLNFGMEPDGMTIYVHGAMEGEVVFLHNLHKNAAICSV